jgi:hypothetical protein
MAIPDFDAAGARARRRIARKVSLRLLAVANRDQTFCSGTVHIRNSGENSSYCRFQTPRVNTEWGYASSSALQELIS